MEPIVLKKENSKNKKEIKLNNVCIIILLINMEKKMWNGYQKKMIMLIMI